MIYQGDKEITLIYAGRKVIQSAYMGVTLIWEAIRSCFGNGYWLNDYPWKNTDGWKN